MSEKPKPITIRCADAQPWADADVADDGELRAEYKLTVYVDGVAAGEVHGYHFARGGDVFDVDAYGAPGLPEVAYVPGRGMLAIRTTDMYEGDDLGGVRLPNYEPGNGTLGRLERLIRSAAALADHGVGP